MAAARSSKSKAKRGHKAKATASRGKTGKSKKSSVESLFTFTPTFNTAYAKRHNRRAA